PVLFATTDEFLKRFKLNSLEDLPDYEMLMAAITRSDDDKDSYLYAREEYSEIGTEPAKEGEAPTEKEDSKDESVELEHSGYEIPDFLRGLDDTDIVKIS
ncbi:MAG: hypothetical protein K2K12_01220, partial [Clostridia bacterium]|nr:hypothetical protein [Clostridia bacterium]